MTPNLTICRLCLKIPQRAYIIDDIFKKIFVILLLKLQMDVSNYAFICRSCADVTRKSCHFKLACIKTEIEYVNNCDLNQDFAINKCRLCQDSVKKDNSISLEVLFGKPMMGELLPVFMAEIEFGTSKNSKVCKPCQENLEIYLEFVQRYLTTEGKINTYLRSRLNKGTTKTIETKTNKNKRNCLNSILAGVLEDQSALLVFKNVTKSSTKIFANKEAIHKRPLKMYTCEFCPFVTYLKIYFDKHSIKHKDKLNSEIYKCPNCTFETKYKNSFRYHQHYSHNANSTSISDPEGTIFKCTYTSCTYETKSKMDITQHLTVHESKNQKMVYERKNSESSKVYVSDPEGTTYESTNCLHETVAHDGQLQRTVCEDKCSGTLKIHQLI